MDLLKKYEPKSLKEFVDNRKAVELTLKNLGKKPLFFYGPPGVGKTTLCKVIAKEYGYELYESNASDKRDIASLKKTVILSAQQQSLFGKEKKKLIVIDEVDGIAGKEDKGGLSELLELIKLSKHPLIFIAQDAYDPKLRSLREKCLLIPFYKIPSPSILKRLRDICTKEGLRFKEETLKIISQRANGDLRAAIMDLMSLIEDGKVSENIESLGYRDVEENIFNSIRILLKTTRIEAAKDSFNSVDILPQDFFWWVEENVIREYQKKEDLAKALDILSKADIVLRWISRRQAWNLLSYFIDLITIHIALAKKESYRGYTKYGFPSVILKMSKAKAIKARREEICLKLKEKMHCSKRVIRQQLPFLNFFIELDNGI